MLNGLTEGRIVQYVASPEDGRTFGLLTGAVIPGIVTEIHRGEQYLEGQADLTIFPSDNAGTEPVVRLGMCRYSKKGKPGTYHWCTDVIMPE